MRSSAPLAACVRSWWSTPSPAGRNGTWGRNGSTRWRTPTPKAAAGVTNVQGQSGKAKFISHTDYYPFRLKDSAPVVKRAIEAVTAQGIKPEIRVANGGLDANWLVRHGIPTVTFGAGQNEPHTVDEWVDLKEYEAACGLAVQLATMS